MMESLIYQLNRNQTTPKPTASTSSSSAAGVISNKAVTTSLRSPYICPAIGPATAQSPSSSSLHIVNNNSNSNNNSYNNFMLVTPSAQQGTDTGNGSGSGSNTRTLLSNNNNNSSSSSSRNKTRWCVPIWGLHLRGLYQAFRSHTLASPPTSSQSSSSPSSSSSSAAASGSRYHIRMHSRSGETENNHSQSNLLLDFKVPLDCQ